MSRGLLAVSHFWETQFCLPRPKVPQRLPQILSREEVAALIESTENLKHRALLMTTYAAGLRLLEVCHLKPADIDSDRMTIRVEQGKGAKDRAGIAKAGGIHALRHAFATHLLEAGTDVHTIQRLMGHGDLSTTARYFHLAQKHLSGANAPLDLLQPPPPPRA